MKILFVSSECSPFAASGGLADVIGALPPKIISVEKSAEVSVIIPYYKHVRLKYGEQMKKIYDISFKLSWRSTGASVYTLNENGVNYYFIENAYYFDRDRLYGEFDDGERFAFFSMAVIEFIKERGLIPDVLHANDWQAALAVIYLKTLYSKDSSLSKIRTLYTIHNIEYQGKFDINILGDVFSLEAKYRSLIEYGGCINLMKGALVSSDYISTVSPNYKNELHYDFFAFGLSPIINSISHKMAGVINGIDYDEFSPHNSEIYFPYSDSNVKAGKSKNKTEFQKEHGLSVDESIPLFVMISRLTAQKGIDLLLHVIEELLSMNIQLAVLGTGESKYETALLRLNEKYDNLAVIIDFDRTLSKKMYAASDFFLMPSKTEPCGLAQMIACSYGSIPIVRSVGGLYDSITHYTNVGGNGLCFGNYNAHELLFAVKDAISLYNSKERLETVRMSAMNSNFSWDNSAQKYVEIYKNLLNW